MNPGEQVFWSFVSYPLFGLACVAIAAWLLLEGLGIGRFLRWMLIAWLWE